MFSNLGDDFLEEYRGTVGMIDALNQFQTIMKNRLKDDDAFILFAPNILELNQKLQVLDKRNVEIRIICNDLPWCLSEEFKSEPVLQRAADELSLEYGELHTLCEKDFNAFEETVNAKASQLEIERAARAEEEFRINKENIEKDRLEKRHGLQPDQAINLMNIFNERDKSVKKTLINTFLESSADYVIANYPDIAETFSPTVFYSEELQSYKLLLANSTANSDLMVGMYTDLLKQIKDFEVLENKNLRSRIINFAIPDYFKEEFNEEPLFQEVVDSKMIDLSN